MCTMMHRPAAAASDYRVPAPAGRLAELFGEACDSPADVPTDRNRSPS